MSARVCVITGSSSGIGRAAALLYARNGWHVAIQYRQNQEAAEQVVRMCVDTGVQSMCTRADVAVDADCRTFAAAVSDRWGRVDVVINSAGTTRFIPPGDLDAVCPADFIDIQSVNVIGAFQTTRAFVPMLRANCGGVVNVSSIAAVTGTGSSIPYMTSKGALNSLTFALARVLAPDIRVNAVALGLVATEWQTQGKESEQFQAKAARYRERAALGAVVRLEDAAEALWWLGAHARGTTGEIVYVDAGVRVAQV